MNRDLIRRQHEIVDRIPTPISSQIWLGHYMGIASGHAWQGRYFSCPLDKKPEIPSSLSALPASRSWDSASCIEASCIESREGGPSSACARNLGARTRSSPSVLDPGRTDPIGCSRVSERIPEDPSPEVLFLIASCYGTRIPLQTNKEIASLAPPVIARVFGMPIALPACNSNR